MKRKVCLFGLSANPPTGESGHLGIIRHLATQHDFDEIRVLPVYSHMFAVRLYFLFSALNITELS